jgi:hypothetical protein
MSDPIERLEGALRRIGEDREPPAGWQDRVKAAIKQPRASRRRWWWLAVPAVAFAALLVLWLRPRGQFELDVTIETAAREPLRGDTATIGDTVHVSASGPATERAVWIYHDDHLVLACPSAPACHRDGETLLIDYRFEAIGDVEIIALTSNRPIPAPTGSLDGDVAAAINAGATEHRRTIAVH